MTFANPEVVSSAEPSGNSVVAEFFRTKEVETSDVNWAPEMFEFAQVTVQNGLEEERRSNLLTQYQVKADVAFLGPPKLNPLLLPILKPHPSVLKRDEFKCKEQAQVGACLIAFGTAMTDLLQPHIVEALPESSKQTLQLLADGIHLLADHQYRLSMARRAFIVPSINLVGKYATDNAPVDEFLFGKDFAECIKNAKECEKIAKDISKQKSTQPKTVPQPARNQPARPQDGSQQQPRNSENSKPPAKQNNKQAHRSGRNFSKGRGRRSSSRSNYHRR